MKPSFVWRKRCKFCGGNLYVEDDGLETYWKCLQCGRRQDKPKELMLVMGNSNRY